MRMTLVSFWFNAWRQMGLPAGAPQPVKNGLGLNQQLDLGQSGWLWKAVGTPAAESAKSTAATCDFRTTLD
jgi:hypothetical protein